MTVSTPAHYFLPLSNLHTCYTLSLHTLQIDQTVTCIVFCLLFDTADSIDLKPSPIRHINPLDKKCLF